MSDCSSAQRWMEELVEGLGDVPAAIAHKILDTAIDKLTVLELAALAYDWPNTWARPKQLPPSNNWRSWGFLTGRGYGKTISCSKFLNGEVEAGRAPLICLVAQDEDSSVDIQVLGPSGLIATAPPWFRPKWEASAKELVWPNGARAYVRTPEVPGKIRGLEYHYAWASELQSWPKSQRDEAFSNVRLSTRLGLARIVWDGTPKRAHPILLELLEDHKRDPNLYPIVRGKTKENVANLASGYVDELERRYGGTQRGKEELGGEMLTDAERAIAKQPWIDDHRRVLPERFERRGLGVDPAVSTRKGSDRTGIIESGLGLDGQGHVLGDYSGKHDPPTWAKIVLDKYVQNACDIVVVETNKGGNLLVQNLRAAAKDRQLTVIVVGKEEKPVRDGRTVFVKEIYSRGAKAERAQPLSTAYERGRVSHVIGVDLASLEETLTTWEPTEEGDSPDDLDALNSIMSELLDLSANVQDPSVGYAGITEMQRRLSKPSAEPSLTTILGAVKRGERI